jgi:hypothetical protein
LTKGKLEGEINLPENTTGTFSWKDKTVTLASGKNSVRL